MVSVVSLFYYEDMNFESLFVLIQHLQHLYTIILHYFKKNLFKIFKNEVFHTNYSATALNLFQKLWTKNMSRRYKACVIFHILYFSVLLLPKVCNERSHLWPICHHKSVNWYNGRSIQCHAYLNHSWVRWLYHGVIAKFPC